MTKINSGTKAADTKRMRHGVAALLLHTQSDARLAELVQEDHPAAFDAIVERYRGPLLGFSRKLLSEAVAQEAVQETFLSAWSALRGGQTVRDLKPWLYQICYHAALRAVGKAADEQSELPGSAVASERVEDQAERNAAVRHAFFVLSQLPLSQREALVKTALEGRSRADTARMLSVTQGAVRQLVHRARQTLRAAATAVVPYPWIAKLATARTGDRSLSQRITELVVGTGGPGLGTVLVKAGVATLSVGAIATGVPAQQADRVDRAADVAAAAVKSEEPVWSTATLGEGPATGEVKERATVADANDGGAVERSKEGTVGQVDEPAASEESGTPEETPAAEEEEGTEPQATVAEEESELTPETEGDADAGAEDEPPATQSETTDAAADEPVAPSDDAATDDSGAGN